MAHQKTAEFQRFRGFLFVFFDGTFQKLANF